ncbi:MAG: hypothetical protein D6805_09295, partial [Planctomycetota bacterium]
PPPRLSPRPQLYQQAARSLQKAVRWLAANQEPNGSWSAKKWGGQPEYTLATSALALLAILENRQFLPPSTLQQNIYRTVEYILLQQHSDGSLGPWCGMRLLNHAIGSLALLKAKKFLPNYTPLIQGSNATMQFALATQTKQGGWNQLGLKEAESCPNTTLWMLKFLLEAQKQGCLSHPQPIYAALRYLKHLPKPLPPPQRLFFYLYSASSGKINPLPPSIQQFSYSLIHLQEKNNSLEGSWPPQNNYSSAGGRVYSTAISTLTLTLIYQKENF